MIDDIKRWLASVVAHHSISVKRAHDWLSWCVAEIERLRAEHVDDQEALFHYRDMCRASGNQRCETCGHWDAESSGSGPDRQCLVDGPSWLSVACGGDVDVFVMTLPNGGLGCDNYERREQ